MKLKVSNISKSFGEKLALDGVSLTAKSGQPLGLLGRNGAGKTTLMRIIMNIFLPDSGEVLLDGIPLAEQPLRAGYLPEERGLYGKTPIEEQLVYMARLRGMDKESARRSCTRWLQRFDMEQHRRAKPETLSKGNQQRIQLAMTLISDPDVIILDEPFSGLDPVNALQLRSVITEQAEMGKLIVISSHQMSTIESFCDHVVMLKNGRVVMDAALSELRHQAAGSNAANTVRIQTDDNSAAEKIAMGFGKCTSTRDGLMVTLQDTGQQDGLLRALLDSGQQLYLFERSAPSLEELFVAACSDDTGGDAI